MVTADKLCSALSTDYVDSPQACAHTIYKAFSKIETSFKSPGDIFCANWDFRSLLMHEDVSQHCNEHTPQ